MARQFGLTKKWLDHLRDRINLSQMQAEAGQAATLIVAGPRGSELVEALQSAGPLDPDAVLQSAELPKNIQKGGKARAAIYCLPAGSTDGMPEDVGTFPLPVFAVQSQSIADGRDVQTLPAAAKPVVGKPGRYVVASYALADLRKYVLPDVAACYGGLEIALAAKIPAFRAIVAARLTLNYAMNSLKIAGASALADHIPILGPITGGIASAGDTIAITAMQMRMLLQIASAYGKKAEFARILELLPVVGGGYGWRTLAREASGFIPFAGIFIKAGIAYAGTLVVGQAAAYYYETGNKLSSSAISALYREATERAKTLAQFANRGNKPEQQ